MGKYDSFLDTPSSAGKYDAFLDEGTDQPPKQNTGIVGDIGTALKRGVLQMPGMATGLADIAAAPVSIATGVNRPVSRAADWIGEQTGLQFGKWAEAAGAEYSPEMQQAQQNVEQAKGFFPTLGAVAQNPRVAAQVVAESLPSTIAGGLLARGAMGAVTGAEKLAALRTAAGSADAAVANAARRELLKSGSIAAGAGEGAVTAGQQMAQTGYDVDPALAAGSAVGAGVGTGIIGGLSGRVASSALGRKLGLSDIETSMAAGTLGENAGKAGAAGLAKRIGAGAIQEGLLEEAPQSYQEQVWQNLAAGKPLTEGAAEAAALGAVAGGVMGGSVNAISGPLSKAVAAAPEPTTAIDTVIPQPTTVIPANTVAPPQAAAGIASAAQFPQFTAPPQPVTGGAPLEQTPTAMPVPQAIQNAPAAPGSPSPVSPAEAPLPANQAESAGAPIQKPQGPLPSANQTEVAIPPAQGPEASALPVAAKPAKGIAAALQYPQQVTEGGGPLAQQAADMRPGSWVIKNKTTGEVILETFDKKKVDALNTNKYEAVPILEYLQGINRSIKNGTLPIQSNGNRPKKPDTQTKKSEKTPATPVAESIAPAPEAGDGKVAISQGGAASEIKSRLGIAGALVTPQQPTIGGTPLAQTPTAMPIGKYGKTLEKAPATYKGMTVEQMAKVASQHGHAYEDALQKIKANPGRWVDTIVGWHKAEIAAKLHERKLKRDESFEPNEKQKKVIALVSDSPTYSKDRDLPMAQHNARSTQTLLARGVLSRIEYGDTVEYRVNSKAAPVASRQTPAIEPQQQAASAFDSDSFDKKRNEAIKASRAAGNVHLDKLDASVEGMRGKTIFYVHNPQQRGVIRTVSNSGLVYVYWADQYSADMESASKVEEPNKSWLKLKLPYWKSVENKKTFVYQSVLHSGDFKDYAVEKPQQETPTDAPQQPLSGAGERQPIARLQSAYNEAKAKLDAIGPEPRKPSPERQAFGANGKAGAPTDVVAKYEASVKAYVSWKAKYNRLKKAEVEASNALFAAKKAAPSEQSQYDKNGYDSEGYDSKGYDREGFNRKGFDKYGYDEYGFDKDGVDEGGIGRDDDFYMSDAQIAKANSALGFRRDAGAGGWPVENDYLEKIDTANAYAVADKQGFVYRGLNMPDTQAYISRGSDLVLVSGNNFDDQTAGISFTPFLDIAKDYATRTQTAAVRHPDGAIVKIDMAALRRTQLEEEGDGELAFYDRKELTIPAGKWEVTYNPDAEGPFTLVARTKPKPRQQPQPAPIMRRDDLVGAIMRVTGGDGIASNMALTIAGDTAGRGLSKLRGLFTNRGTIDLGEVATRLREDEGFDVRDGEHLSDLIRAASFGDTAVSMERAERDQDTAEENRHRDYIRQNAKKLKIKSVAVKFTDLEQRVIAALTRRHERAIELLDERAKKRFDAALEESYALLPEDVVDAVLVDVNGRGLKTLEFWKEATRLLRYMVADAKAQKEQEALNAIEGAEPDWLKDDDGRGNKPAGVRGEVDRVAEEARGEAYSIGDEITFTPHPERRLDSEVSGILVAKESTGSGRFRLRIRTDRPSPQGDGFVTLQVYSQNGSVQKIGDGLNAEAAYAAQKAASVERGSVGASLTKEQRKSVLRTLVDVYKANKAPRESKGFNRNGEEIFGYAYSPEYFVKSDITGKMVRYYVTLPDGRAAHPTELFPDYTQSNIDGELLRQKEEERQAKYAAEFHKRLIESRKADDVQSANRIFWKQNSGGNIKPPDTILYTDGKQFVRGLKANKDKDLPVLGEGWTVVPVPTFEESKAFDLAAQTPEEIAAAEAAANEAKQAEAAAAAAEARKEKAAQDKAEKDRRAAEVLKEREAAKKEEVDKAAEEFALGQVAPEPVVKKVTTEEARGQEGLRFSQESPQDNQPAFYSQLSGAIASARVTSQPAAQWKAWINGNAGNLGIKKDEIEWSGVNDWLDMMSGGARNAASVEKEYGADSPFAALWKSANPAKITKQQVLDYLSGNGVRVEDVVKADPYVDYLGDNLALRRGDQTKFSDYWQDSYKGGIPGTYREILVTLPASGDNGFKSNHWDEPNVLVHIRTDEVIGADGKRYLRVGEIQSDWGQKGKKEGFGGTIDSVLKYNKMTRAEFDSMPKSDQEFAIEETKRAGMAPSAPFVTDTRAWAALGIKRAIIHAINSGVDGVVFGTGEQNANLYDLSKQVDSVAAYKNPDGSYYIQVERDGNFVHEDQRVLESRLPDMLGKDLAEKIVAQTGVEEFRDGAPFRIYRGLDLKVGGEGMRAFYDQIIPSVANDVLKKVGGGKVESVSVRVSSPNAWMSVKKTVPVYDAQPGFTITPQMRAKIQSQGVPLFSFAGQQSATADQFQLDRAKQLLADGANANAVRQQTGWFKGVDGKWRYEISDDAASLTMPYKSWSAMVADRNGGPMPYSEQEGTDKYPRVPLDSVIDHPALFAAYPNLRNVQVFYDLSLGSGQNAHIDHEKNEIGINSWLTDDKTLSSLLHEIQHGIQNVEGFASGGNLAMFGTQRKTFDTLKDADAFVKSLDDPYKARIVKGWTSGKIAVYVDGSYDPYRDYKRLAGEVESRNVQQRQNFPADKRKYSDPLGTQDVAPEDVIVMFNGKDAKDAPAPANTTRASAMAAVGASPADAAVFDMASEGRSAQEILAFLSKASRRPFNRVLAAALSRIGVASTVSIDPAAGWRNNQGRNGAKFAASYSPETDTVSLYTPREAERHVLHEFVHAASLKAIARGGPAARQMQAIFDYVQRSGTMSDQYGMGNFSRFPNETDAQFKKRALDEFTAELFTNPLFQVRLKQLPAPSGSKLKSAWDWVVRVIANLLGLKTRAQETALDRALSVGAALLQENASLTMPKGETARYHTTWHGSPHKFYTFDLSKIGTGEGAQAYGHGLYVAEAPGVAEGYAGMRPAAGVSILNGKEWQAETYAQMVGEARARGAGSYEKGIASLEKDFQKAVDAREASVADDFQNAIDALRSMQKSGVDLNIGQNFYKVDLPAEAVARMLDWDAALSNQPPEVQSELKNAGIADVDKWTDAGLKGRELYNRAKRGAPAKLPLSQHDDQAFASERLKQAGIPGIRYIDQQSRSGEKATSNFVLFDDKLARIIEVNGVETGVQPWAPGEWEAAQGGERFSQEQPFSGREVAATPLKPGTTTLMVDGVERPALNSNGKPIHWSEEGVRNFWRWFQNSAVTDADGRPRSVFHGSKTKGAAIKSFDLQKSGTNTDSGWMGKGFYFGDETTADVYAGHYEFDPGHFPQGGVVYPSYLLLKNPLTLIDSDRNDGPRTMVREAFDMADSATADEVRSALIAAGHDGVIYQRTFAERSYREYVALHPEQVKSSAGNTGAFSEDPDIRYSLATNWQQSPVAPGNLYQAAKKKAASLLTPERLDKVIYEMQDKFVDLRRIRDHIKEIGGTITDLNDAYLGEELYHKRLAYRTEQFLKEELQPFFADMKARDVTMPEFEKFLHARHAPEANDEMAKRNPNQKQIDAGRQKSAAVVRGLELNLQTAKARGLATVAIEKALTDARAELVRWNSAQAFKGTEAERLSLSGMSTDKANRLIDSMAPEQLANMNALAAKVDAINEGTLQTLERYGLMDKTALNTWRNTYKHYVPLHRDEAHPDSVSHPIGQGFNVRGDASKRRTGSNQEVTNIFSHIAMQREAALTRGEKNRVMQKIYLMARQNPIADIWSVGKVPMIDTIDKATGFVRSVPDPQYKDKPNVITLRIGGKDVAIVMNEYNPQALRLAQSIKNLDVDDLHYLIPVVGKATRLFASINTQYNPIFGLINFARDVQTAALNLSTTAIAGKQKEVFKDTMSILGDIIKNKGRMPTAGKWAPIYKEFNEVGGTTGYRDLFLTAEDRSKAVTDEIKALDRGKISQAAHAVAGWLSDYNEAMENATRLAAYKAAIDNGMSKERAASLAKNLTVNFNRKGRQTRELGALYAFFNAAVQGTARMAQTLSGPAGKKIMLGGVLAGSASAMAGIAAMGGGDGEDDEWSKIPEFVKERSFIIPAGKDKYIAIPMPLGFHFLPNIGRLMVEMAVYKDKTLGKQMASLFTVLADAFNPLGGSAPPMQIIAPTVMDPFISLAQNKDWTGKPIYVENFNSLNPQPGAARAKDSATPIANGMADIINSVTGGTKYVPGGWSPTPDQIDYVIGQLTGGVGRELGKLSSTIAAPFTGDELPAHKIPLLGRLYGSTEGATGQAGKFYENIKRANEVENELKGRRKDGISVDDYLQDNPKAVELAARGNAAERQIRALRQMRSRIVEAGGDDAASKARQINERMATVMRGFNMQVERMQ